MAPRCDMMVKKQAAVAAAAVQHEEEQQAEHVAEISRCDGATLIKHVLVVMLAENVK